MPEKRGKKEEIAQRRSAAWDLRIAGASYRQIGRQLGVSEAQAHRDVTFVLKEYSKFDEAQVNDVKTMELSRLDTMLLSIWQQVKQGNHQAIDRALKIMSRRAALLGLDAPTKLDINWQREFEQAGINPAEMFEKMVQVAMSATEEQANE